MTFDSVPESETAATTATTPLAYSGTTTVTVADVSGINAIVGTDADYFVYLWGPTSNSWTWLRGEVTNISTGSNQLDVALSQNSGQGATFSSAHRPALEEGISYRLNSGSVMRGTTTDFSSLTAPTFSEQTIGINFTALTFTYYDAAGAAGSISSSEHKLRGPFPVARLIITRSRYLSIPAILPLTDSFGRCHPALHAII